MSREAYKSVTDEIDSDDSDISSNESVSSNSSWKIEPTLQNNNRTSQCSAKVINISDSSSECSDGTYESKVLSYLSGISIQENVKSEEKSFSKSKDVIDNDTSSSWESDSSLEPSFRYSSRTMAKKKIWETLEKSMEEDNKRRRAKKLRKKMKPKISPEKVCTELYLEGGQKRNDIMQQIQVAHLMKRQHKFRQNVSNFDSKMNEWFCEICKEPFEANLSLNSHMVNRHEGLVNFICKNCGQSFFDATLYNDHFRLDHSEKPSVASCYLCRTEFSNFITLLEHLKEDHIIPDMYSIRCQHCSGIFLNKEVFDRHFCKERNVCHTNLVPLFIDKTHKVKPNGEHPNKLSSSRSLLKCEKCGSVFKRSKYLRQHLAVHHQVLNFFECYICSKTFGAKYKLVEHFRYVHSGQTFSCEVCGKQYQTRFTLNTHMKKHRQEFDMFGCMHCGQEFHRKQLMVDHVGEMNRRCPWCNIVLECRTRFLEHIDKKHRFHGRLECTECRRDVHSLTKFWNHLIVHHPEQCRLINKNCVTCEKCRQLCSSRHHLKKHQRKLCLVSENNVCKHCNTRFSTNYLHAVHLKPVLRCAMCGERFECLTLLKEHIYYGHGENKIQELSESCAKKVGPVLKKVNCRRNLEEVSFREAEPKKLAVDLNRCRNNVQNLNSFDSKMVVSKVVEPKARITVELNKCRNKVENMKSCDLKLVEPSEEKPVKSTIRSLGLKVVPCDKNSDVAILDKVGSIVKKQFQSRKYEPNLKVVSCEENSDVEKVGFSMEKFGKYDAKLEFEGNSDVVASGSVENTGKIFIGCSKSRKDVKNLESVDYYANSSNAVLKKVLECSRSSKVVTSWKSVESKNTILDNVESTVGNLLECSRSTNIVPHSKVVNCDQITSSVGLETVKLEAESTKIQDSSKVANCDGNSARTYSKKEALIEMVRKADKMTKRGKICNEIFQISATNAEESVVESSNCSLVKGCSSLVSNEDCDRSFEDESNIYDKYGKISDVSVDSSYPTIYPYKCYICNSYYHRFSHLECHKRLAHDEDDHFMICDHCGKQFKKRSILERHFLKYKCTICDSKFECWTLVKFHCTTKHRSGEWCCELCSRRFRTALTLVKHARKCVGVAERHGKRKQRKVKRSLKNRSVVNEPKYKRLKVIEDGINDDYSVVKVNSEDCSEAKINSEDCSEENVNSNNCSEKMYSNGCSEEIINSEDCSEVKVSPSRVDLENMPTFRIVLKKRSRKVSSSNLNGIVRKTSHKQVKFSPLKKSLVDEVLKSSRNNYEVTPKKNKSIESRGLKSLRDELCTEKNLEIIRDGNVKAGIKLDEGNRNNSVVGDQKLKSLRFVRKNDRLSTVKNLKIIGDGKLKPRMEQDERSVESNSKIGVKNLKNLRFIRRSDKLSTEKNLKVIGDGNLKALIERTTENNLKIGDQKPKSLRFIRKGYERPSEKNLVIGSRGLKPVRKFDDTTSETNYSIKDNVLKCLRQNDEISPEKNLTIGNVDSKSIRIHGSVSKCVSNNNEKSTDKNLMIDENFKSSNNIDDLHHKNLKIGDLNPLNHPSPSNNFVKNLEIKPLSVDSNLDTSKDLIIDTSISYCQSDGNNSFAKNRQDESYSDNFRALKNINKHLAEVTQTDFFLNLDLVSSTPINNVDRKKVDLFHEGLACSKSADVLKDTKKVCRKLISENGDRSFDCSTVINCETTPKSMPPSILKSSLKSSPKSRRIVHFEDATETKITLKFSNGPSCSQSDQLQITSRLPVENPSSNDNPTIQDNPSPISQMSEQNVVNMATSRSQIYRCRFCKKRFPCKDLLQGHVSSNVCMVKISRLS